MRPQLDRDVSRDQGQRPAHGRAGREPDPRGDRRARRPTMPRRRSRSSSDDAQINEVQRTGDGDDRRDDRDPAAGRPRPALPAHAGPRGATSSSGWATTRSVAKQARKLAPHPPLGTVRRAAARWARSSRTQVRGIIRALVDVDEVTAREVAALDDEVDNLYHADLRRGRCALMRERPGQRRARHADPVRRRTTSSGSATGSRTSPRTSCSSRRRDRGPQPVSEPIASPDPGPRSSAPATRRAARSARGAPANEWAATQLRRLTPRARAAGRQPADDPGARGGRHRRRRLGSSRSTGTSASGSTT